jgi:hypothetical protein
LPEITLLNETEKPIDAALLFVNNMAETDLYFLNATKNVIPGGLLWLAYPKKSSKIKTDVNRDILWEALKPTGWRPVRMISLDDTWSVMRMRPEVDVTR